MLRCFGVAFVMTIKINTLHGLSRKSSSPDRPPVSRELPPEGHKMVVSVALCFSSSWSSYSSSFLIVRIIIQNEFYFHENLLWRTLSWQHKPYWPAVARRSSPVYKSSWSFAKIKLHLKSKLKLCHYCASLTSKLPIFLLCVCNNED